jgi:hypothetical protein
MLDAVSTEGLVGFGATDVTSRREKRYTRR